MHDTILATQIACVSCALRGHHAQDHSLQYDKSFPEHGPTHGEGDEDSCYTQAEVLQNRTLLDALRGDVILTAKPRNISASAARGSVGRTVTGKAAVVAATTTTTARLTTAAAVAAPAMGWDRGLMSSESLGGVLLLRPHSAQPGYPGDTSPPHRHLRDSKASETVPRSF